MTVSNSNFFKEGKRAQGQNFIEIKQQKIHDIEYIDKSTAKKKTS